MRFRASTGCVFAVTFAALLAFSALSSGQIPQPGAQAGPNPQVPWLHEGLQFTSTWMAAIYSGHGTDFKEDEHGGWVAPDGTRLQASDRPGTSAGGVSQTVVSCIDGDKVFLVNQAFSDMRLLGFRDPIPQQNPFTYFVSIPMCDLWVAPALLAQAKSDPEKNMVVVPVQWKAGNQMVDAVRVITVKPGHYIDHVFERSSGLCLHAAESSTGAAPEMKYIAPGDTRAGDTNLSQFDFISLRDVPTPWATEAMPAWTSQFKALHYRGETRGPNTFYGPATPTLLGYDVARVDGGNGWLGLGTTGCVFLQGQPRFPSKGYFLCGRGAYNSFFAGPAALGKLQQGQVLDTDPVTNMKTVVGQVDANSVTIVSSNASAEISRTYDRQTGKMIAFARLDGQTKFRTVLQLQGEE